ncbi:MAG: DUF4230 domain-containing protein, partial [Bacteroidota bacterium]
MKGNVVLGRVIIIMLIVSIALIAAVKFWPRSERSGIGGLGDLISTNTTKVPKEIPITYLPSNFKYSIDEEDAVAIMTNPLRYKREFNNMVKEMNLAILNHVANRMDLNQDIRSRIVQEYEKSHPYLRNLYYQDFLALRDSSSTLGQQWFSQEAGTATEVLHEVASKYTCYLVNQIMATVLNTENGAYWAKGKAVNTPCGIALQEALGPMIKRFQQTAAVNDFSRSKGLLEERVEKVVTELATYELDSKKGLSKQLKTKMFGLNVSSTDIEIQAASVMKIGFKLDQFFSIDLNPRNKVVTVTMPQPQILSHEVYPRFDKLDIGWMREVKEADLNASYEILRKEFVQEARQVDVFNKAKAQVEDVMMTMLGPVISSMNSNYKIR